MQGKCRDSTPSRRMGKKGPEAAKRWQVVGPDWGSLGQQ